MHTHACMHACMHICICIRTFAHSLIHAYMHTCTCMHTWTAHTNQKAHAAHRLLFFDGCSVVVPRAPRTENTSAGQKWPRNAIRNAIHFLKRSSLGTFESFEKYHCVAYSVAGGRGGGIPKSGGEGCQSRRRMVVCVDKLCFVFRLASLFDAISKITATSRPRSQALLKPDFMARLWS